MFVLPAVSRIVFSSSYQQKVRSLFRVTACAVLASVLSSPLLAANTIVRMEISFGSTPAGNIDIELDDDLAPKTVLNFLRYAGRPFDLLAGTAGYENSVIHRHAKTNTSGIDVIQGGGFIYPYISGQPYLLEIPPDPPVPNEFSPSRPNKRSTIAMAKLPGDPNSATSQWFINVADNPSLDDPNNNGGFTVFGRVLAGMNIVDAITNNLKVVYLGALNPNDPSDDGDFSYSAFRELPVLDNYDSVIRPKPKPLPENLVLVTGIPNVKSISTIWGTSTIFTADPEMTFSAGRALTMDETVARLSEFTPPPKNPVQYIAGILTFKVDGVMGPGRKITLLHGSTEVPNHYYAYGKTLDNQTNHWYDFAYDGTTGAEIKGDRIVLHFVDGQRGDDDLTTDSITHTGTAVLSTEFVPIDNGSGCTIAAMPSKTTDNGDWILILMFLVFVALVRRRVRH